MPKDSRIDKGRAKVKLFGEQRVRTVWDGENEKWWFSVVNVIAVLTESDYQRARKYWKVLKGRLLVEGNETVTDCYQLKLPAPNGRMRLKAALESDGGRLCPKTAG